jgi:hypothetical protein
MVDQFKRYSLFLIVSILDVVVFHSLKINDDFRKWFEVIPIRTGVLVKKMKFYIQKVCKFNKRHHGALLTTFLVLSSQLVLIMIL